MRVVDHCQRIEVDETLFMSTSAMASVEMLMQQRWLPGDVTRQERALSPSTYRMTRDLRRHGSQEQVDITVHAVEGPLK